MRNTRPHRAIAFAAALLAASASLGTSQEPPVRLTLGDAARLAARQSGRAVEAAFRTQEFDARVRESRSDLLPAVSLSLADGQRSFNTASFGLPLPGFDPQGQVIGPVRTVDIRGRVVANIVDPAALARYRSAQAAAGGAAADAAATAEEAAVYAASAYVRTLRAEAQVAARAADSALAGDLLEIAQSQLRAGVGVGLDVTRAQSQLAAVRAELIAWRNERDRARLELARSVGLPLSGTITLVDSLGSLALTDTIVSVEAALEQARRTRPDLRAATAAVKTARRDIAAARAERLPTLGLFADDGLTSNGYAHLLNTYMYGVQLTLPVFGGFRADAHVREQTAVLHQAETRERDLLVRAEAEVRGALLDLTSAREQGDAARDRLRLAEQELSQARERFRAGVAGNADVISAQLNLDDARSQLVDALTALQTARISLARSTGHVTSLP